MNKSTIIILVVGIIALLLGLMWLGQSATRQANNQTGSAESPLTSDEKLFDFGTISMANGNVSREFKITNSSDKSVNIRKISTSCMCTSVLFKSDQKTYGPFKMEGMGSLTSANITLNPGDTAVAEAVYDPNAHGPAGVGQIDRFVYIQDASGGRLELEIKALVTP